MVKAMASKYYKHLRITNKYGASKTLCEAAGKVEIIGLPTYAKRFGGPYDNSHGEEVTCPECKKIMALRRLDDDVEITEFEKEIGKKRWEHIMRIAKNISFPFEKKMWLTGKKTAEEMKDEN